MWNFKYTMYNIFIITSFKIRLVWQYYRVFTIYSYGCVNKWITANKLIKIFVCRKNCCHKNCVVLCSFEVAKFQMTKLPYLKNALSKTDLIIPHHQVLP